MPLARRLIASIVSVACAQLAVAQDFPERTDAWVNKIDILPTTTVKYVAKTEEGWIFTSTEIRPLSGITSIRVGDSVEGLRIGAIRCQFHTKDASYAGEQFMWRGKWACMAGRTQSEIQNAVDSDGRKNYPYLHAVPVDLGPR